MKKIILSLSALYLFSTSAAASNAIKDCRTIENDLHRLMCYDAAVDALHKKQAVAPPIAQIKSTEQIKPKTPQINVTPVTTEKKVVTNNAANTEFGLEHKDITGDSEELVSVIAAVKKAPRGELIITLDNGQVWRQLGTDRFRVKEGFTVIISRGIFNSFLLKIQGKNKSIRVKRTS